MEKYVSALNTLEKGVDCLGGKTAQLFYILRMKKEIHQKLYWSGEKQTRNTFWKIFVMSLSGEEIEFYENYILLKNLFIWNNWPYGYCWWGKHYQIPEYVSFLLWTEICKTKNSARFFLDNPHHHCHHDNDHDLNLSTSKELLPLCQ